MRKYLFIILIVVFCFGQNSQIIINEFLAGSDTCCGEDIFNGNTEDFVELYNYGTEPININGWGFSDTDGVITTIAPDTSIAPGDFLVLWYTGDNNGFPEINEKLSKNGESIFIADANSNPLISYDFGPQTDDISYGRTPDGSDTWEYFLTPTPGESNSQILKIKNDINPVSFALFSAYPNPFNPITSLRYDLPNDGLVNIIIYDMMGRIVKTLVNRHQTAGFKSIQWNATNDRNEPVSAGFYLYTIQTGNFRQTKKMVLLK